MPLWTASASLHAQLHALAALGPPAPLGDEAAAAVRLLAGAHEPGTVVFVTSTLPTLAAAASLVTAVRANHAGAQRFVALVVDLGLDCGHDGGISSSSNSSLASLLELFADETMTCGATLFAVARTVPERLVDELLALTVAQSASLALGECALHLAPTLSLSVQVRRALVPPLDVKHVLLCRCHGTPVAFSAGAAYCVQTTQLDRFDVLEALQVGGTLFSGAPALAAPTEAPSAAAFCETLMACSAAPIDPLRIGGAAPLLVLPRAILDADVDFALALKQAAANTDLFAAVREQLIASNQGLLVRAANAELFALLPSRGLALALHAYLPATPLAVVASSSGGSVGDESAAAAAAAAAALGALQCESIGDGDPAFVRWRNEAALAALMQASPLVARRTTAPAPMSPTARPSLALVAPPVVPKKRRFNRLSAFN
jgi:hypothetical protein